MNKGILSLVSFAAGGAVGYLTANRLLREHYEQKTQEDIASTKEAFLKELNRYKDDHPASADEQKNDGGYSKAKAFRDYLNTVRDLEYTASSTGNAVPNGPEIISLEVFGSEEDYDELSLTYYADGTLTDDADRIMDDAEIENTIGRESLRYFVEHENDALYVRNDRLKADYEIVLDPRSYGEVLREKPYLR